MSYALLAFVEATDEASDESSGGEFRLSPKAESQMQAYCMKCRAKKEIKNAKSITIKNGRSSTQGPCPTYGTKVFRTGKS